MQKDYVSRAALKLEPFIRRLKVDFSNKVVLDIGSSTGGFTQLALENGAKKVIAIEKGTNQMDARLKSDQRVDLREKTDFLELQELGSVPGIVMIDVSFISVRFILKHLRKFINTDTKILLLFKPQFEVNSKDLVDGIIKNETIRRRVIKDFELWLRGNYLIVDKEDSPLSGLKGNKERVYSLRLSSN